MVEQPILTKITAWFTSMLPAIAGSIISLKLAKDGTSIWSRFFSFFCGILLAHYFGWGVIEYFHIEKTSMIASSIIFIIGIFGVSTVTEISTQIPTVVNGWAKRATNFLK